MNSFKKLNTTLYQYCSRDNRNGRKEGRIGWKEAKKDARKGEWEQRKKGRNGGKGGMEREKLEQVTQGQYVASDTRCPDLHGYI